MKELSIFLALIAIVLTIVDALQTVYIARHPSRFFERNPILGRHPSVQRVLIYFGICLVLEVAGAVLLNAMEWTGILFLLSTLLVALEAYWVVNNYRLGIRLGWQD